MRKTIYIIYALWVAIAITLGIIFKNPYILLSPIILPALVVITIAVLFMAFVDLATLKKKREDAKIEDSCEICLFNETSKYSEEKKCMGCVLDENHKFGEMCPYYSRHIPKDRA